MVALFCGLLGGVAPPASATTNRPATAQRWSIESTESPSAKQANLLADSCPTSSFCVAVGTFDDQAGSQVALAETWNGTAWTVKPTPNPPGATDSELVGVSCTSASACTAVGSYGSSSGTAALAEEWNGTTWSVQPVADPTGTGFKELEGVSCGAPTACTAVGTQASPVGPVTLAEGWNGTVWATETTVNPPGPPSPYYDSVLGGVSCTSATTCTAVGWFTKTITNDVTLVEVWNGTGWKQQSSPNPSGAIVTELRDVSCSSMAACTAVGLSYSTGSATEITLSERWNGTAWTAQTTPNPPGAVTSSLGGVSCSSASACTAIGSFEGTSDLFALAEAWNGTSWNVETTPNPATTTGSVLDGVSCSSPTACTTVGFFDTPAGALTLAERSNGTAWALQSTRNPPGPAAVSQLNGVSCSSASACTAVGYFQSSSNVDLTLAESWNGTAWKIQTTPNPADAASYPGSVMAAVSCSSARACMAVGSYTNTAGVVITLAESWNGTAWKIRTTPNPAGATNSALESVSCSSPVACTAVGRTFDSAGTEATLAESWNGAVWTLPSAPIPPGATGGELSGVSCPAAKTCTAVGSYNDASGTQLTLAEVWNGDAWSIQTTPNPTGATASALVGVACAGTGACMAVGHVYNVSGTELTLAEAWNGTAWNVRATGAPADATASSLDGGLSCQAANACAAVGSYNSTSGTQLTLAESWNGTTWSIKATPNPVGAIESELNSVSCSSGTACIAVGYSAPSLFNQRNLAEATS